MKKLILAATISTLAAGYAAADSYNAEVGLAFGKTEFEAGSVSDDRNFFGAMGELYFEAVDTSKGPLNEAAFLDKASSVGVSYFSVEDADDDNVAVNTRIVVEQQWIFEAEYADTDGLSSISVGGGLYLSDDTDLVVRYTNEDDTDTDTLSADLHSVRTLGDGSSLAFNVALSYVDTAADSGYGLDGEFTYYLDNNFGIGAAAGIMSIGDADVTSYDVHASYFVTRNVSVEGYYSVTDFDGPELSVLGLGASMRF